MTESIDLGSDRAIAAASTNIEPLGWPSSEVRASIMAGINTNWDFELVCKALPPQRFIREMFGQWRVPNPAGSADPFKYLPSGIAERHALAELKKLYPKREWWCPLRAYALTVMPLIRVVISTRLLTTEINPVFKATFKATNGEEGLRQALVEFAHGLGVGP